MKEVNQEEIDKAVKELFLFCYDNNIYFQFVSKRMIVCLVGAHEVLAITSIEFTKEDESGYIVTNIFDLLTRVKESINETN